MNVVDQLKRILQAGYKANPIKTGTERIHSARLRGRRALKDAEDALQHEWDIGAKIHVRYCLPPQVSPLLGQGYESNCICTTLSAPQKAFASAVRLQS